MSSTSPTGPAKPYDTHASGSSQPYDPPQTGSNTNASPYDPYIPAGQGGSSDGAGPSGGVARQGDARTAALQAEIDSTVGIMRENIHKVAERGERLDNLQDKTDNLAVSAQGFRRGASRVRKDMWFKDLKWKIIIAIGICVLIVVIVVPIVKAVQGK